MVEASLYDVILTSFLTSGCATLIAVIIGIPLGAWCSKFSSPLLKFIHILVRTLYGLPPVVVGVFVYLMLSKSGPLADLDWLFTVKAMIMAQTILVLPIIWGGSWNEFSQINSSQKDVITTLGASERQAFLLQLNIVRKGLLNTIALGFGRAIAEVGAVFMVGGNIAGKTRVMTTSIVLETQQGNMNSALWLGLILLLLVCSIMATIELSKMDIFTRRRRSLSLGNSEIASYYSGEKEFVIDFDYGDTKILNQVEVRLEPGKILAVFGPSGCGKTTLLRCLAGLQGDFSNIGYGPEKVGWVPQNQTNITSSVVDEIALASKLHPNLSCNEEILARKVGLESMLWQKPSTLSGGEMQRLGLIRTLGLSPSLLLLDEFTSNLDAESTQIMEQLVLSVKELGAAVVLVSHDSNQVERLADEVLNLG